LEKKLEFPKWLSVNAKTVLEGLLERNPQKRWSWEEYRKSEWVSEHFPEAEECFKYSSICKENVGSVAHIYDE